MTNHKKIGNLYEKQASDFLQSNGYSILDTNYHCPYGEIDLIAQAPDHTIVFIEVKARNTKSYGYAAEALTSSKCHKIRKTSYFYISEKKLDWNRNYRYDVILFQDNHIEHLVNAFY